MIYFQLFLSFLQVGLFSIGGGYAAMPLIQSQIVDMHGWLSLKEFADLISISQMTPGPIAINSATFVGIKIAGVGGAIVATLGCILPSCVIVLLLAYLYHRFKKLTVVQGILNGLRPAVVALIASAGLTILLMTLFSEQVSLSNVDVQGVLITAASIIFLRVYKPNPIYVIAGSGAAGLFFYYRQALTEPARLIVSGALIALILLADLLRKTAKGAKEHSGADTSCGPPAGAV